MKFGQGFREQVGGAVGQELDHLMAGIRGGWKVEHDADGHHTDITGDSVDVTDGMKFGGPWQLARGAVLTPPQITANTNDYNPQNLASAVVLRLSTDASRNITGIVTDVEVCRWLMITNIGNFDVVLKHNVTSTTRYRLACPNGVDVTVNQYDSVWLFYDVISQIWRVIGL